MVLRLIEILREEPNISQEALGEKLGTTRRVLQELLPAAKRKER
jgi:DNA-binding helix-turn-helix protein